MLILGLIVGCKDPWGGECFVAGTQITMEHGDTLGIEEIQVGDYVQSMDVDSNKLVSKRVLGVMQSSTTSLYSLTTRSSKIEGVTAYHPFYIPTTNEWTHVEDLQEGDPLVVIRDNRTYIEKIEHIELHQLENPRNVYNFTVAGPQHNYFAESLLVHNKDIAVFPEPYDYIEPYITSPSDGDVLVEGEQTFEANILANRASTEEEETWNIDVTWTRTMNDESSTIEECSQTVTILFPLQYNAPEEPVSIECVMSLVPGEGIIKVQTIEPESTIEGYDRISFTVIPSSDTGSE